jgi:hypothetical protein
MHLCMCTYTHISCVCVCVYIYIYIYIYDINASCMCVMYVCMCTYTHISCVCVCIHIYIYTYTYMHDDVNTPTYCDPSMYVCVYIYALYVYHMLWCVFTCNAHAYSASSHAQATRKSTGQLRCHGATSLTPKVCAYACKVELENKGEQKVICPAETRAKKVAGL